MDTTALAERLEAESVRRECVPTRVPTFIPVSRFVHGESLRAMLKEAATRLRAVAGEPVAHQFQDADGRWHGFHSDKHRDDTIADGSWPIRALYLHPATVTDEDVERGWMAFTGRDKLGPAYADDAKCMTREERHDMRAALESFANKEPTDE